MPTGAQLIARTLHDLDVRVLFGLVGVPVVDIAEAALELNIRFIAFRNEQAASYAASVYGYLTGRPGVCLLVGGPGILHGMAGIGNAMVNCWPMVVLGGNVDTFSENKGGFQELGTVALLTPHTKLAIKPSFAERIPDFVKNAYRVAYFGRPGCTFVDLPGDMIRASVDMEAKCAASLPDAPKSVAPRSKIQDIAQALKDASAPLVVIGKGAAYARAEEQIRALITNTGLPFLPTPMGKGVMPDSDPRNTSAARSTALRESDVILVLGARLNWILHYGEHPKWRADAKIIQVDICADELGKNQGDAALSVVGDVGLVIEELTSQLRGWQWRDRTADFAKKLDIMKAKNEAAAAKKAAIDKIPMTYEKVFSTIKSTLHGLSRPEYGSIVYVCEGSNTMDISRSIFTVEHPRLRLDAATYATMGIGLPAAIAAHAAYNLPSAEATSGKAGRKKIVAIEGDSAFGFCAMEVETMARYGMDVLIFVINNGGIYQGSSASSDAWLEQQRATKIGQTKGGKGLRSLTLGYEVRYEKLAESCGGIGMVVRTPEELRKATNEGFRAEVPVVVNVLIESGSERVMVSCHVVS